jgi:long-chain fatty acid transport protein
MNRPTLLESSMKMRFAAAGLVFGLAGTVHAAGYGVDTQDARATGMATAVTALTDDAAAVLYNAAGVVHGPGLEVRIGDTLIAPSVSFSPTGGGAATKTTTGVVPPPNFYATYGISNDIAVGIGVFSPYGLVTSWPSGWQGQFLAQSSSLATYYINPTFAVRIADRVKLGVGIDIVRATVDIKRQLNFLDSTGTTELGGGAWGSGANAGIQVDIVPKMLTFGAQYRGQVPLNFSGNAHFSNVPSELQGTLTDQSISASINLPDTWQLGLGIMPIENLRIGIDTVWTNWSTFQQLAITFNNPALNLAEPKNWSAEWNLHIGAEYAINDAFRIRVGFLYDPTPSPANTLSPDLPDATRYNIAAGVGYHWNQFQADLGYQYVILTSNTSTYPALPGTYSGNAQVVGLSVGYKM